MISVRTDNLDSVCANLTSKFTKQWPSNLRIVSDCMTALTMLGDVNSGHDLRRLDAPDSGVTLTQREELAEEGGLMRSLVRSRLLMIERGDIGGVVGSLTDSAELTYSITGDKRAKDAALAFDDFGSALRRVIGHVKEWNDHASRDEDSVTALRKMARLFSEGIDGNSNLEDFMEYADSLSGLPKGDSKELSDNIRRAVSDMRDIHEAARQGGVSIAKDDKQGGSKAKLKAAMKKGSKPSPDLGVERD